MTGNILIDDSWGKQWYSKCWRFLIRCLHHSHKMTVEKLSNSSTKAFICVPQKCQSISKYVLTFRGYMDHEHVKAYTLLLFFSLFDPGEKAEDGLSPTDFPLFALITDSCWAFDSVIILSNSRVFDSFK